MKETVSSHRPVDVSALDLMYFSHVVLSVEETQSGMAVPLTVQVLVTVTIIKSFCAIVDLECREIPLECVMEE